MDGDNEFAPMFVTIGGGRLPLSATPLQGGTRNYKCPKCGGEFEYWEGERYGSGYKRCPFCGLKQFDYEPDEEDEAGDSDVVIVISEGEEGKLCVRCGKSIPKDNMSREGYEEDENSHPLCEVCGNPTGMVHPSCEDCGAHLHQTCYEEHECEENG